MKQTADRIQVVNPRTGQTRYLLDERGQVIDLREETDDRPSEETTDSEQQEEKDNECQNKRRQDR